jgi:hypothetical protein
MHSAWRHDRSLSFANAVAWCFDTRLLDAGFVDPDALDATSAAGDMMLLWEPPSLDQRIAGQSGLLSIMNTETGPQNAFLQMHCNRHSDLLIRIVLSAKMKSEARDMLYQNNTTERAFVSGVARTLLLLKRYYGTSW